MTLKHALAKLRPDFVLIQTSEWEKANSAISDHIEDHEDQDAETRAEKLRAERAEKRVKDLEEELSEVRGQLRQATILNAQYRAQLGIG